MVQQRGEPLLLPFPRCLAHTVQSLGHALPALCRGRVWLLDVLLGPRPSLPNLRRPLPPLFGSVHRYYAAVRLLRACASGLRLCAFADRPARVRRRTGGLPVLVHVVSQRARGLRLRDRTATRVYRGCRVAFPVLSGSASRSGVFRSSIPGPPMPLSTLRLPPRERHARLEVRMVRYLLSCRALSSPTTCRFIPAHGV